MVNWDQGQDPNPGILTPLPLSIPPLIASVFPDGQQILQGQGPLHLGIPKTEVTIRIC